MYYVLRKSGTSCDFVSRLPHDYDPRNFVSPGWEDPASHGALRFDTEADARRAKDGDPDGESLSVEEIR